MTDLDQRIASVLRERAEGEADTHRLLRAARARGRRRQLRRRAATGTALAAVVALGVAGVTGTDLGRLPVRVPWTAATPAAAGPVPPRADGVPGAARQPDLVGTDARVLHLGVDTGRARYLRWGVQGVGSAGSVESVQVDVGGRSPVLVEVSRSSEAVEELLLDGVPVEQGATRVTFDGVVRQVPQGGGGLVRGWQPVPGLYARASTRGDDRSVLLTAVQAIRWDEARRCDGPLRLGVLPEGAQLVACSVDATAFPGGFTVELILHRKPLAHMQVRLLYGAQITRTTTEGNRVVAGRPAALSPDGQLLELLGIPKAHLTAQFGWQWPDAPPKGQVDFTEADAASVLAGARVPTALADPQTWK
ncbi:hypothetical protein ACFO0M_12125 [Micromonospora mangrovi]|uniref:LigA protein n=2 Tax=Micromonospora TaxID=1873 RepID=A0AAU7M862_9ACTN